MSQHRGWRLIPERYRLLLVADRLLPILFASISLQHLSTFSRGVVGIDARIYYRAASTWLAGGNPWDAFAAQFAGGTPYHFAALPPTVVLMAPFTLVPEELFLWGWIAASALAAIWILRKLSLHWWWILFPPTVLGVVSGNPQIILLGLLLSRHPLLAALAPLLKIYAAVPLIGERRIGSVVIGLAMIVATVALAASMWGSYFTDAGAITDRLREESEGGYSGWVRPVLLLPPAILGLALLARVDLRAAFWLAVPALFPSTQFHVSTLALPVLAHRPSPWLAAGLALPFQGLPALVIAAHGVNRFRSAWRAAAAVRSCSQANIPSSKNHDGA